MSRESHLFLSQHHGFWPSPFYLLCRSRPVICLQIHLPEQESARVNVIGNVNLNLQHIHSSLSRMPLFSIHPPKPSSLLPSPFCASSASWIRSCPRQRKLAPTSLQSMIERTAGRACSQHYYIVYPFPPVKPSRLRTDPMLPKGIWDFAMHQVQPVISQWTLTTSRCYRLENRNTITRRMFVC